MTLTEPVVHVLPDEVEEQSAPPRRPSPVLRLLRGHPAWIVVVGACALLVRTSMQAGLNTDVFWHLAAGQWMLHHHAIVRQDPFSYSIKGHPWFAEEWGFEVLLAWMVAHLGAFSYWLLAAGPCCAALVISVMRWRRQGARPVWSAALAIATTVCLIIGVATRPQALSYGLFALELFVLTLSRQNPRWLLSLPALFLFWANVHGSYLAGLGVLALDVALATGVATSVFSARTGRRLIVSQPLPFRRGVVVLGVSMLAACVNPHGPALYSYALKVTTSSRLAQHIAEWQSPDFHLPIVMAGIALPMIAAVVVFASGDRRIEMFDLILWLVLLLAALRATRFMPYLGIALGGMLAPYQPLRSDSFSRTVITPVMGILLCLAILSGGHPVAGTPETKGSLANPVEAASWLSSEPGRVFSTYVWNDYLISKGVPVFVDGRTDMYFGTGILESYLQVSSVTVNPDPTLARYHVEWVLWPKDQPLSLYLAQDPRWKLVRSFGSQLVFQRAGAAVPSG